MKFVNKLYVSMGQYFFKWQISHVDVFIFFHDQYGGRFVNTKMKRPIPVYLECFFVLNGSFCLLYSGKK